MGLGEVGHSLSDFFGLGEEKGHVEGTSYIQELGCLRQCGTFFAIGSPLTAIGEVKEQLRGAACLPHSFPLAAPIPFCLLPPGFSVQLIWSDFQRKVTCISHPMYTRCVDHVPPTRLRQRFCHYCTLKPIEFLLYAYYHAPLMCVNIDRQQVAYPSLRVVPRRGEQV